MPDSIPFIDRRFGVSLSMSERESQRITYLGSLLGVGRSEAVRQAIDAAIAVAESARATNDITLGEPAGTPDVALGNPLLT